MKRSLLVLLLAGCSAADTPANPPPSGRTLVTGFPGKPALAHCDASGRWGMGVASIEHWIFDPREKKDHDPSNGGAKMSIFRDSLPFPQFSWGTGDFEITQLLFPAGDGFMARYHVMNHGDEPRTVRLYVGLRTASGQAPALASSTKPSETSAASMAFDLKIDPGASQFITLTTPGAEGRDPNDALNDAAAAWEKILARPIALQDLAAQAAYVEDLAGRALGLKGADERVRSFEERFVKREGNALRLFGEVPEAWILETIDVKNLKTAFGPLSFKHTGFYNNRVLDLDPGCTPTDGFLMTVGAQHKAKLDGKEAQVKDGVLRIPAGTKRVELVRPL
jgi:hypothetical protein